MFKVEVILILLLFTVIIKVCKAQDEVYQRLVCIAMEDCSSCQNAGEFCHWCDNYDFNTYSLKPSCNTRDKLFEDGCPYSSIVSQKQTFAYINENEPLQDITDANLASASANQIRPQRVTLGLRKGQYQTVKFEYRAAKDYPLDLYYLMDLTWTMRDDKETLVSLRNDLPISLRNLTKHFRLAFGSYADKPLMPYTNMDSKHRPNPCLTEYSNCEPTYDFKHRLSLTSSVEDFVKAVNDSKITGNLDNTEALFDALVQVAVCSEEIDWLPHSRKIVIVATDSLLHLAGTGILGGAVKRNDQQCHLDKDGLYTEDVTMDYPSLEEVSHVLTKQKVSVIFAVTEDVKNIFDEVHKLMIQSTYVGKLEKDSSNILNLVSQGFEDFVSTISFQDNATFPIKVEYFTDCGRPGEFMESSKCTDIKIGEAYTFFVNVTLLECPADYSENKKRIVISESQLSENMLTIDVEMHCKCDCQPVRNTSDEIKCPENSIMECGKCKCLEGWLGPDCDCKISSEKSSLDSQCYAESDKVPCSGAGDCLCGKCLCDAGFSGNFCECVRCEKSLENGIECGGNSRGTCSCGKCICRDGWEGPGCSCPSGKSRCILPGDNQICSGRGQCRCGECLCSSKDGYRYSGAFCETCTNCDNTVCTLYEECAKCVANKQTCSQNCSSSTGILYNHQMMPKNSVIPQDSCILRLAKEDEYCDYVYTYKVNKDRTVDINVYEQGCTTPIQPAFIGGGLFLATLLIGLLCMMCVKVYYVIIDKRAYMKFQAEIQRELSTWDGVTQNPIYKSPITEVRVPDGYNRNKKD